MPEAQGLSAIGHMTKATDVILFSSTPYDLDEPTHFNVRPLVYWLQAFRDQGFSPDLDFDAGFVCSHAILFRRGEQTLSDEVLRLYANFLHRRREIILRDGRIHALQTEKPAGAQEDGYRDKIRVLEGEIAEAVELQEKLHAELELATNEIEQLAGLRLQPSGAAATNSSASSELLEDMAGQVRSLGGSLKAMEYRLSSIEQQNANLATSLSGIVESKIWRTLVRGGGALQKLLRL